VRSTGSLHPGVEWPHGLVHGFISTVAYSAATAPSARLCPIMLHSRGLQRRGPLPTGNIELNENMEFASPPSILPYSAQRTSHVGHRRVGCVQISEAHSILRISPSGTNSQCCVARWSGRGLRRRRRYSKSAELGFNRRPRRSFVVNLWPNETQEEPVSPSDIHEARRCAEGIPGRKRSRAAIQHGRWQIPLFDVHEIRANNLNGLC
jgi:hypothetical protein